MKKGFGRPSPAMVVAVVALIVALCGTAIAGGVFNKKKVKKVANNVVTQRAPGLSVASAKSAASAATATNAAQLGGLGPGSFQSRIRWALVAADGQIAAQSGGITNDAHDPASCPVGCDFLNFGSSQVGKALLTTPVTAGQARPLLCGGIDNPGGVDCPTHNDTSHIQVNGLNPVTGAPSSQEYWIAVVG